MINYDFYLDENYHLCCRTKENGKFVVYQDMQARELLQLLDCSALKRVQLKGKNVWVKTEYKSFRIVDIEAVLKNGNTFFMKNIIAQVQNEVALHQKAKHKQKKIRNMGIVGVSSSISLLAFVALSSTISNQEHIQSLSSVAIVQEVPSIMEEPLIPLQMEIMNNPDVAYLDFSEERYSEKGTTAYELWYDIVFEKATKWGLSPQLAMAFLTQESAGKETNLMQIEFSAWEYKDESSVITVYNFEKGNYESFVLSNNLNDFVGKSITCITEKDLENPKTNISIGCVLLRKSLQYMDYHIGAGIQCYNFGKGNMNRLLEYTAQMTGVSVEDIISNQENLDFMNYTEIVMKDKENKGDFKYLQNVLQFVENPEEDIWFKVINSYGEIEELHVAILPSHKRK